MNIKLKEDNKQVVFVGVDAGKGNRGFYKNDHLKPLIL